MKWKLATLAAILTLALAVSLPLLAQQVEQVEGVELDDDDDIAWARWHEGGGKGMMEELALTKEQQKKMDDMRTSHRKEMIPLRAQVEVKQIELQELFESDASLATVSSKIDEISKLKTDIAKKQAGHRIAMRQVLTPENFARIQPGMDMAEVRRLLGKPAKVTPFDLKNETHHDWRYLEAPNTAMLFTVVTDRSLRVLRTQSGPDMTAPENAGGGR